MSNFYFQDANGPSAEAILCFSDLTLTLIIPISFLVTSSVFCRFLTLPSHRGLIESQALEFVWTCLPACLLLLLSFPSLSPLYLLDEVGFPTSTSKIIGSQWFWSYECADLSPQLSPVNSYLVPGSLRLLSSDVSLELYASIVLRFLISSSDVLHSWTVPGFGLKVDAVPGRLNQLSAFLDRTGVFYGQCSEICGSNHSFMPIKVEVLR